MMEHWCIYCGRKLPNADAICDNCGKVSEFTAKTDDGEEAFFHEELATATLMLETTPPGANISLDGVKQSGVTPWTVLVDMGLEEHKEVTIAVALSGYASRRVRVPMALGQMQTLSLPLTLNAVTPPPEPTRGRQVLVPWGHRSGNSFLAEAWRHNCFVLAHTFSNVRSATRNANGTPQSVSPTPAPSVHPVETVLQLPVTKFNPEDGAEMILIPAGEFCMGDDDQNDNPRRKVDLSDYYIYKNLVTVGVYEKFCQDTGLEMPYAPSFNPEWSNKDHPIVNVSWGDATAYCDWADVKLPTEQEWEKAARGQEGRKFPWGDKFDRNRLWCSESRYSDSGGTASVNRDYRFGVGFYGVNDMAGNVWQWCADWYDEKKDTRVLRGGSWINDDPDVFRSANRLGVKPTYWFNYFGFRCCASPGIR